MPILTFHREPNPEGWICFAAGSVQITDFFQRIVQPSVDVTEQEAEQQQQQQRLGDRSGKTSPQGQGETAEQRRRLLAEAALQRQQASSNPATGAHVQAFIPNSSAGDPSNVKTAHVLLNGADTATGTSLISSSSSSSANMRCGQRDKVHSKGAAVDQVEPECDVIFVDEDDDDNRQSKLPNGNAAGIAGSTLSTSDLVDLAAEEDVAEPSEGKVAGHISSRLPGAPVVRGSEAV